MVTVKRKGSTVEIRDVDELYRVLKEVRAEEEPLVIQGDNGDEIVVPPGTRRRAKRRTAEERAKADEEAFLSSAGSWVGHLDPDEFLRQVKAARGSRRPYVEITLPEE